MSLNRLPDRPRRDLASAKRALDFCASALGLLILAPVFVAVAAAVRFDDGGPAFYRQVRVGRDGVPFRILKFRSMSAAADRRGPELTIAGDNRITRIGALIRRYKIDELPQLWNVLRGEMSLIGPRPETPALMEGYSAAQRAELTSLRPGVTDWASLLLKNESELLARASDPGAYYRNVLVPLKCELCRCYRGEAGLRADLQIVAATLWALAAPEASNPFLSRSVRHCFDAAKQGDLRLLEPESA